MLLVSSTRDRLIPSSKDHYGKVNGVCSVAIRAICEAFTNRSTGLSSEARHTAAPEDGHDPKIVINPGYVNQRLVAEGIAVQELRMDRAALESVFLSLTGPAHLPHGVNGQLETTVEKTKEVANVR